MTRPRDKTIRAEVFRIYPIEGVEIPGVPTVERDVTEAEWLALNEYRPPAFVCDPLASEDHEPTKEGKE